jgi:hypothetical protein
VSIRRFAIGCALAVIAAGGVDSAGARECCNITCGLASPICIASDDLNCEQLCDAECVNSGGCTTFGASTCSPDLAVVSCDENCDAVCAAFTPTPTPATTPAPTMSLGMLTVMAALLGVLAVVGLRQRRQQ